MTSTEVLTTTGLVLADFHVGVAEPDDFDSIPILDVDSKLFRLTGGAERLVECDCSALVLSHLRNHRYGRAVRKFSNTWHDAYET